MTNREDIALQLTLANTQTIKIYSRQANTDLCNEVINFYNTIFENIKTSDLPKLELK